MNIAKHFNYWGKKEGKQIHSVAFHGCDAAAVSSIMMRDIRFEKMLKDQSNDLETLKSWIKWEASAHDVGKISLIFTYKLPKVADKLYTPLQKRPLSNKEKGWLKKHGPLYYHGPHGYYLISQDDLYGLPEEMRPWFRDAAGHHGVPVRDIDLLEESIDTMGSGLDRKQFKEYFDFDSEARGEFIHQTVDAFLSGCDLKNPPVHFPLISGIIAFSDWVSSNSDYFSFNREPMPLKEYYESRLSMAEEAVKKTGVLSKKVSACGFKELYPEFNKPRDIQKVVGRIKIEDHPSMFIVEGDAGLGKTETGMLLGSRILKKQGGGGIVFTSPSITSADCIFERLTKTAPRIFGEGANVMLAHSRYHTNPFFRNLPCDDDLFDPYGKAQATSANWIARSRKRFLFADISVSTIDQVLLAALGIMHQSVRQLGLSKNVLIVDEVHDCDVFLLEVLKVVIAKMRDWGCSVILLSATLSNPTKEELLSIFYKQPKRLIRSNDNRYPLITTVQGKKGRTYPIKRENVKKVKINVSREASMLPSKKTMIALLERALIGQKVAVICNIVNDAQYVYEELKRLAKRMGISIKLTHSRFVVEDRINNDSWIIDRCLKGSEFGNGCIVVSTQVIQQSLDLDFDFMVTQLCPMDILLQRLGRLYRAVSIQRNKVLGDVAECLVLLPDNSNDVEAYGSHAVVYNNLVAMWRTDRVLDPKNDGSGRKRYVSFPKVYRIWSRQVFSPKKNARTNRTPRAIKEYTKRVCMDETMKRFAAERTKLSARDVILRDNGWEEVMTRLFNWTEDIHLVFEPVHGEPFLRAFGSNRRLYDPKFIKGFIKKLEESGRSSEHIRRRSSNAKDQYLRLMNRITVSIPKWHQKDLAHQFRDGICFVFPKRIGTGKYRIKGIKNNYIYCRKSGWSKEM